MIGEGAGSGSGCPVLQYFLIEFVKTSQVIRIMAKAGESGFETQDLRGQLRPWANKNS